MVGNNSELNDDEREALAVGHHRPQYEKALKAKKDADSTFRNTCKRIKAEGTDIEQIKLLIQLDTPEGEAELRADLSRRLQVARWAGSEIGTQFSFLDEPDRTPLDDRAYLEGKRAGAEGKTASSPYTGDAEQEWLRGHADGQRNLMSALDLTKAGMEQIAAEEGNGSGETKKRGRPKGSKNRRKTASPSTAEETDPHADEKARDAESFEGNPAPPYA